MTHYLIDIRIMGSVQNQIRQLSDHLTEKFSLESKMVVPHITLAGPFSCTDEEKLVQDFCAVCKDQTRIPKYELGGYGFFNDTRVVYVTITPDETLRQFRYDLAGAIAPYCSLRQYDLDSREDFAFHATLAMKLGWLTFQRIKWHFRHQDPVVHRPHPIRATLLRNSRILCEYDFVQERMLTQAQAMGRATRMRDLDMLKAWDDSSHGRA